MGMGRSTGMNSVVGERSVLTARLPINERRMGQIMGYIGGRLGVADELGSREE